MTGRLGFSTGSMRGTGLSLNQRLEFLAQQGHEIVELGYVVASRFSKEPLSEIDLDLLSKFSRVSMHGPGSHWHCANNSEARNPLDDIQALHEKHPLDLVVFHPDSFADFEILSDYTFPIGMENMDPHKKTYQQPDALMEVFQKYNNFHFVLDLNHVYANDQSMKLIDKLLTSLQGKLTEIQISGIGSGEKELHIPLFQTRQDMIISALPKGDWPIIIESKVNSLEEAQREYEYIAKRS